MSKRDITILVFAIGIIGVSVFFMLRLLFPPQANSTLNQEADQIPTVPATVDEGTYQNVEGLADYGQVDLSGIGKEDLFASYK